MLHRCQPQGCFHVGMAQSKGFVFIAAATVEERKQTSLRFQDRDVKLLYKE